MPFNGIRRLLSGCAAIVAVAAACSSAPTGTSSVQVVSKPCGTVRIAVNPWTGSAANAHALGYVARTKLGCAVTYVPLAEQDNWAALEQGVIDVVPEVWGHEAFAAPYLEVRKTIVDAGLTGGDGTIGWFVPPWMARQYPGVTDWQNLNSYAALFRTPKSGAKGQLLSTDPTNVNNDGALVANLKLDFAVVPATSELELVQAIREAERTRTPLLAYLHAPQWIFTELKMARVSLPVYDSKKPECAPTVSFRCDYPQYALTKMMSAGFAASGSPAVALVRNFSWTNKDQNVVAAAIDREGLAPDEAAKVWVDRNSDRVAAWLTAPLS